jgi:hypothetical protein
MAAPPKKCIFCVNAAMSNEHVWGRWISRYVKEEMKKHHFHAERIHGPGEPTTQSTTLHAGPPLRGKVKVVCKGCNSGWLSIIQETAKPILISLIQGKNTVLGRDAQQKIARWATMATMTGEYLDRDPEVGNISISQAEREWLWKNNTPPSEGWRIWVARYQRYKWIGRWYHSVMPILKSADIPESAIDDYPSPNTQTTTFAVGELYIHVMSTCSEPTIVNQWIWPIASRPGRLLTQIWPPRESIIAWPPESLTDGDADFIATAFDRIIDAASRSMLGRRLF